MMLVLILAVVVSGAAPLTSYAAVNVPDRIRVALFLNLGTKYQAITAAATLSSSGGLALSWRDSQNSLSADSIPAGQPARFSLDGYRAIVAETYELNAALVVLKKLQASSQAAFVTKLSKSGKTVYQVTEGVYPTAGAAATAVTKWTNAGAAAGVQSLQTPKVAGPWAVEAGPYTGRAEAEAAAELIGAAGLDTFVALKPQNNVMSYVVRVGQEKDASSAAALQQAASAASGANVRLPAASEPYAVIRNDMTYYGSANRPVSLYAVPLTGNGILRADPEGEAGIHVAERSKRTYRGSMEISAETGSLAVINDVDLEQYLYSVVGTEVSSGWPPEAQKAQAVAARSYALAGGMGFKLANVVDTTVSQAYYGIGAENPNSTAGVNGTKGEVLTFNGRIISALFSANAGGITADAAEGWGNPDPKMASAAISPDSGPQNGKMQWYRVATSTGDTGYVREDLAADSGQKNAAGIAQLRVTGDGVIVRSKPLVDSTAVARLSAGTLVVSLGKVPEVTVYSWVEAPKTAEELLASLNKRAKTPIAGPLNTLEVSRRGPSGRAIELQANGVKVAIEDPDNFRSALGGIRSTLFSIEETGRLTVRDADGTERQLAEQTGSVQIQGAAGEARTISDGSLFVLDGSGQLRAATAKPEFVISGKGWGHGIGMSQWGARGMAEQGYDYQSILKYYYKNVLIEKDAD
ncbi:hypothetical protein SD71_04030 [Cohnella kolymensis]|uniref:SPOR domain-containing protein n=2 Tax=Cohnella kolymensis TaxID=1590652 RepID=A0ABR5A7Q3_9BACL|nr:hypothetical protein SD71_04030 [Cohnella kolymensis]